jgi:hypothetical protein
LRAVAPERFSTTNQGVVESYTAGNDLAFVSAALADDPLYCDHDGMLDGSETGTLTVTLKNVGTGPLGATTGVVSATNGLVSFPNGGQISFPASQPFATTSAALPVSLAASSAIETLDFNIAFSDPGFAIPGTVNVPFPRRGNVDDLPNQAATETAESATPPWTLTGNPSLDQSGPWRRLEVTGTDHRFWGPDSGALSDQYLVSPVLNVAAAGSFSFTFRHRYSFEFATGPLTYFDGGVLEISNSGGASWSDVGAAATPGYSGFVAGGNPLGGNPAFVGVSPGYPAFTTVTVDLGGSYAGQNVLIRFRIGTDVAVGAAGWEIDDIAFTGITNLPFRDLVPDRALCVDSDADGVPDLSDCADLDAGTWAVPSEARLLSLIGSPATSLSWSAPASPGSSTVLYDLLRSPSPALFGSATCLESGEPDLAAADAAIPANAFFYLIRARNGCGGNLGKDSANNPRSGAACP